MRALIAALALCQPVPEVLDIPPREDVAPDVCLADLYRFPGRENVTAWRLANRSLRDWLTDGLYLDAWLVEARQARINELDAAYQVWDELDSAQASAEYGGEYALEHLAHLRDLLGLHDYYSGRLPPPIPLEYLR